MNEDIFEQFKNNNAVINCITEEDAAALFEILKNNNIYWRSGNTLNRNKTAWNHNRQNMCYRCNENELSFASVEYYAEEGKTIYTYEDLIGAARVPEFNIFDYLK